MPGMALPLGKTKAKTSGRDAGTGSNGDQPPSRSFSMPTNDRRTPARKKERAQWRIVIGKAPKNTNSNMDEINSPLVHLLQW